MNKALYEAGNLLVCVDDIRGELTYGNTYKISDVWGEYQPTLRVKNDKGEKKWYYYSHFMRCDE